jgi:predicted CopG family antitoxin
VEGRNTIKKVLSRLYEYERKVSLEVGEIIILTRADYEMDDIVNERGRNNLDNETLRRADKRN